MTQIIPSKGGGGGVGLYKFKGSVQTYNDLPTSGLKVGDTYNVVEKHTTAPKFPAGSNLAWTGTEWDVLGGNFDLSDYQEKLVEGDGIDLDNDTNVISVESDVINGAAAGATAVQPGDDVSTLNNDAGYIDNTVDDLTNYTKTSDLAAVALSNDYDDLDDKPTIGDATITIQKNGTKVDDFGVNDTSNTTVNITMDKSDVGLSNVDNTSDLNKPISTATQSALDLKANSADLATVATTGDYDDLIDKPTIGNATLTIQRNGTQVNTFTANATSNVTANISVPTDTGDLTNGAGFIDKEVDNLTNYTPTSSLATVATSGSYSDLSNKPTIGDATLTIQKNSTTIDTFKANATSNKTINVTVPTKTSDLINDSNFIASTSLATVATTGDYDDLIDTPSIIDNLTSTSATDALSANQGKVLKDLIDTYVGLGRFLSLWDASTGQPISFPLTTPYTYNTGDWYMVETVSTANPPVNYMPSGSSYTGTASTTQDTTNNVEVRDVYIYDGTDWLFQKNNEIQVSFSDIAGSPSDNTNLANALSAKQDVSNMVTTLTGADNDHYPTAKAVSDALSGAGNGDMLKSVYDPNNKEADAFNYNNFINTPNLAAVATSGAYSDLSGTPTLATVATSGSYNDLSNKPTIPTVNNATLTIQKNGTNVNTFTANASSNVTANITVPTDTQDLTNTAGFITLADIPSQVSDTAYAATWNGVTDTAPSKNAVYDKISAMDTTIGDKADDSSVVHLTGAETILDGLKVFESNDDPAPNAGSVTTSLTLKGKNLKKGGTSGYKYTSIDFKDKDDTLIAKFSGLTTPDGWSGFMAGAGTDPTSTSGNLWLIADSSTNNKLLLIPPTSGHNYGAVRYDYYNNNTVRLSGNQTISGTKTFNTSPVVPSKTTDAANSGTAIATEAQVYKKQDSLISGTNIKTINNESILGSGNINITSGVSSVNGKTGDVTLNADDISDSSTTKKFTTAAQQTAWSAKMPGFSINISHAVAGNPREVKFITIDYGTMTQYGAAYFRLSAASCHPDGGGYNYMEDIYIGCTYQGVVKCDIIKYVQSSVAQYNPSYESGRYFGDVFYVVDTDAKKVYFYILGGQYTSSDFTPAVKIGSTSLSKVTQHSGTGTYYDTGTKVWANGCGSLVAIKSDIPSKTSQLSNDSGFLTSSTGVTSVNGSTGAVTGLQTTANLKTSLTDNSDSYYPSQKAVKTAVDAKQDTLVSGTNIKTVNGNSLLGSGNIDIQTGGNYTAGNGIDITNDEIGLDGTYDKTTTHSDMQGPCPDGFHIPKRTERGTVKDIGTTLGAWAAGSSPSMSNMLKLPLAGCRYSNTGIGEVGSGFYRSCSYANHYYGYELELSQYNINQSHDTSRSKGNYIRAFKDNPIVPTSSWTVLYQGTGSAGIFRDSSLGLISLSSDGTTWITIQDKNLGATTVWNSGDTLSEANCGNVFQWGNNNPFPGTQSSGTITTSSTTVSVAGYGPGNYYSSNTWITANPWQLTTDENNLRGGVSQGTWVSQTSGNLVVGDKLYKIVTSTTAPASGTASNIITFVTD